MKEWNHSSPLVRRPSEYDFVTPGDQVCDSGEQGIRAPADIALELDLDLDSYGFSKHFLLKTVETDICSKTSIVPPTYLDRLTSKIPSRFYHDHT